MVFKTGLSEVLLSFLKMLHKITKGHRLTMLPKMYAMTNNILSGEAFQVFEQQAWSIGKETKINYKLVIKGLTNNFSPHMALQRQKMYLLRGLFKPCYFRIREFICLVNEMV